MRIACLYFPTSSVGGIATNVASFRAEAVRRGDTFRVLECSDAKTHKNETYPRPKRIRGGDTFIDIDGRAPHAPERADYTAKTINANYDLVYLAFLCPHPTKAYGDVPKFIHLLRAITLPIVGHITDGYFDSYAEWGHLSAGLAKRVCVDQLAYIPNGFREVHPNLDVSIGRPFDPVGTGYNSETEGGIRTPDRSMVWISQWKAIKGIHRFIELLPSVSGKQDLYSNGILYYQMRSKEAAEKCGHPEFNEAWRAAVGPDRFNATTSGGGAATFHGWQPTNVIREALSKAWFMPEFQGLGRPKNRAYQRGSMNHTILEALYAGCTPVIPQMSIDYAGIPPESAYGVVDYGDSVAFLNGDRAPRPDLGKQWVLDNFNVSKVYDDFFGGLV